MKKIILCFLAFLMFFNSLPVYAIAQAQQSGNSQTYQVGVNFDKQLNQYENSFRKWASMLLAEYLLNLYLENYDPDKTNIVYDLDAFEKNEMKSQGLKTVEECTGGQFSNYCKKITKKTEVNAIHEICDYHPYYRLAKIKYQFDISERASKVNMFGDTIRLVDFSIPSVSTNAEERQYLYTTFILQTIKEKQASQQNINKAYLYMNFDVESGLFITNSGEKTIAQSSTTQAEADLLNAVLEMTQYAFDGQIVYDRIMTKFQSGSFKDIDFGSIDLDGISQGTGTNVEKYTGIITDLYYRIIDKIIDGVFDSLSEMVNQWNSNMQASYDILSKDKLKDLFLEELVSASDETSHFISEELITYSEYGNQRGMLNGYEYEQTIKGLINILSQDEYLEKIMSNQQVSDELTNTLKFSFDNDVMNSEQLAQTYFVIAIDKLFDVCTDILITSVTEGFTKLFKELMSGIPLTKKISEAISDFVNGIFKEANKRYKTAAKEALKETLKVAKIKDGWEKTDNSFTESFQKWKNVYKKYYDKKVQEVFHPSELGKEEKTAIGISKDFGEFCLEELLTDLIDSLFDFIKESRDKSWKELVTKNDSNKDDTSKKNNNAISVIATTFLGAMGEYYWEQIISNDVNLPEGEKRELKNYYDNFLNSLQPFKEGNSKDLAYDIPQAILNLLIFIDKYNDYYNMSPEVYGLEKQRIESHDPKIKMKAYGAAAKKVIENKDLWNLVFSSTTFDWKNGMQKNGFTRTLFSILDRQPEFLKKFEKNLTQIISVMFQVMGEYIPGLWDQAKVAGSAFWTAIYSLDESATSENIISFESAICYLAWEHSKSLEDRIKKCANASRTPNQIIKQDDENYMVMSPQDILDSTKTPDLNEIYLLTRLILMQNDFDATGMGSYYTISTKYGYYTDSMFGRILGYGGFSDDGKVLLIPSIAKTKYDNVATYGRKWKRGWDESWNVLFSF